ncbi:MAG: hypothetical protein A2X47_11690 [Lentisphaerae bacterium GWF2_38_69]|nr:MAG: hypothetical protein A2X47_11690 [Lentisphaerae bacterium GWF2_38_69]
MEFYFEKFKAIREQKNIAVKEISIALNKHRVTVWAWESGKQKPCLSDIRELAKILHVDISEISDIKTGLSDDSDSSNIADNISAPLSIEDRIYLQGIEHELLALRKKVSYLQREKKELQSIANNIQTLIYRKDSSLKFVFANKAFLETLNLSTNKLVGTNNSSLFLGEEMSLVHSLEVRILKGERITNHEIIIPGTRRQRKGYFSGNPIYDNNGIISGIAVSIEDITDKSIAIARYKQLEDAVNLSQDILWIKDIRNENSYSFISSSIDRITGYKIKHFNNNVRFWIDTVVHPDSKRHVLEFYKKRNWEKPVDYKILTANGEIKYLREKCYSENGMQFGVIEDRTSKMEAEKYQLLLLDIIHKVPYVIWLSSDYGKKVDMITDTYKPYLDSNSKFVLNSQEMYEKFIHPEDTQKYIDWKESISDSKWWNNKSAKTIKTFLRYKLLLNGKSVWVEEQIFSDPVLRKRGIRYGILRDITEEIQNSTTLRLLKDVINKVDDLVWVCTPPPNARYLYISDAIEKIWGRSVEEFKDDAKRWLEFIHPDDRETEKEAIEKDEFPMHRTYRIIRPDGKTRKLQSSSFRDIDENGNMVDFGVIRDITDRCKCANK